MINGKYLYETHMHTMEASKCSDSPAREYISRYRDFGYDGIIITDHFYHGNCAIDRSLPWPEFVRRFCLGYYHAREEGERQGFPVFFGWVDPGGAAPRRARGRGLRRAGAPLPRPGLHPGYLAFPVLCGWHRGREHGQ